MITSSTNLIYIKAESDQYSINQIEQFCKSNLKIIPQYSKSCKEPKKNEKINSTSKGQIVLNRKNDLITIKTFDNQKQGIFPKLEQEKLYMSSTAARSYTQNCIEDIEIDSSMQLTKKEQTMPKRPKRIYNSTVICPKTRQTVYSRQASLNSLETVDDINFVDDFDTYIQDLQE
ncbi:Hypothetical_protein [Hexamita inflata]|uniref:Hypothetical_protein n=1 Tax=Hexamita inflata TaxID=28002 RepID=A0AA86Q4A8_9EUKA|nr:Hypothetical protein HINF_LOCUS39456 [Hexamita inflata]